MRPRRAGGGGGLAEVRNGCCFMVPPRLAEGLEDATEAQLAQVVVLGSGSLLYCEALDTDLSVPGLFG